MIHPYDAAVQVPAGTHPTATGLQADVRNALHTATSQMHDICRLQFNSCKQTSELGTGCDASQLGRK